MAKKYSVGVAGESHYREAIATLREGEYVDLVHEPGNPHDPRAIAVRDGDGQTIGYLPRDHWLTGAMLDEGKSVKAIVKEITGGADDAPDRGVVLEVEMGGKVGTAALAATPVAEGRKPGLMEKAATAALSEAEKAGRAQRMKAALGPSPDDEAKRLAGSLNKDKDYKTGCVVLVILALMLAWCAGDGESGSDATSGAVGAVSDDDRRAVISWRNDMMSAMVPCDLGSSAMAEQMQAVGGGQGSMLNGYRAASRASEQCLDSFSMIGKIDAPDGPFEDLADEAIETCQTTASTRRSAAESAMTVFDGDFTASAMSTLQDDVSAGAALLQACVVDIVKVTNAAGLEVDEGGNLVLPKKPAPEPKPSAE